MRKYHVALSFAGEDRAYVGEVATHLAAAGVEVFYDGFEEVDLWGKDLYAHLREVYQAAALFTVVFISKAYLAKIWTNHERQSAQARAISESREYILPAYFDTSIEVPGLPKTTGHVSLSGKSPRQLADLIVQKLAKAGVLLPKRSALPDGFKEIALDGDGLVSALIDLPIGAKTSRSVEVEGITFMLDFTKTAAGMAKVDGIKDQHNPVRIDNMPSRIKRAARKGGLVGV